MYSRPKSKRRLSRRYNRKRSRSMHRYRSNPPPPPPAPGNSDMSEDGFEIVRHQYKYNGNAIDVVFKDITTEYEFRAQIVKGYQTVKLWPAVLENSEEVRELIITTEGDRAPVSLEQANRIAPHIDRIKQMALDYIIFELGTGNIQFKTGTVSGQVP